MILICLVDDKKSLPLLPNELTQSHNRIGHNVMYHKQSTACRPCTSARRQDAHLGPRSQSAPLPTVLSSPHAVARTHACFSPFWMKTSSLPAPRMHRPPRPLSRQSLLLCLCKHTRTSTNVKSKYLSLFTTIRDFLLLVLQLTLVLVSLAQERGSSRGSWDRECMLQSGVGTTENATN